MRKYETIFIINPDLSEEDTGGVIEKVKGIIESLHGEVLKVDEWGRRRLAYEVKKMSKGLFVLLHFAGTVQVLSELERNLSLMDPILKFQTVRLDEKGEKVAQLLSKEKSAETEEKPEAQTRTSGEDSTETGTPETEAKEPPPEASETREEPEIKTPEETGS